MLAQDLSRVAGLGRAGRGLVVLDASPPRMHGHAFDMAEAAGHPRRARIPAAGGLTAREAEVLRLLALGLTTRDLAQRLSITPKTADHHIQHVYSKLGVSTRGAAALLAVEHGVLPAET